MTNNNVFFVNIYPTNDRRLPCDHRKLLRDMISHIKDSGISHTLLTVGDKRFDPIILGQAGMEMDQGFNPLIAINPLYIHPVDAAKKLASLASLYPNEIAVNLVTGSFFNEMKSVGDNLSFSERSQRLLDFYQCLKLLLEGRSVTFESSYYELTGAEIYPKIQQQKFKYFVSGTLASALQTDPQVYYLKNIKPLAEQPGSEFPNSGLALGLCVRKTKEEALRAVKELYPEDRRGEMLFNIALVNQETPWNEWLKVNGEKYAKNPDYYLEPMKNYWSAAPFIVDSYEGASLKLKKYHSLGYSFFVLDYKVEEGDHIAEVLRHFHET